MGHSQSITSNASSRRPDTLSGLYWAPAPVCLEKHSNKSNKSFDPMDVGNEKVIKEYSGPFIDKMIITVVDFMMLELTPF